MDLEYACSGVGDSMGKASTSVRHRLRETGKIEQRMSGLVELINGDGRQAKEDWGKEDGMDPL